MEGSPRHGSMTDSTRTALLQLATALAADPAGAKELDLYGGIVEHIGDAIEDLGLDPDAEEDA